MPSLNAPVRHHESPALPIIKNMPIACSLREKNYKNIGAFTRSNTPPPSGETPTPLGIDSTRFSLRRILSHLCAEISVDLISTCRSPSDAQRTRLQRCARRRTMATERDAAQRRTPSPAQSRRLQRTRKPRAIATAPRTGRPPSRIQPRHGSVPSATTVAPAPPPLHHCAGQHKAARQLAACRRLPCHILHRAVTR